MEFDFDEQWLDSQAARASTIRDRENAADEAVADLWAAWKALKAAGAEVPGRRWWRKRQYRNALAKFGVADSSFRFAFTGIARAGVGSVPHRWGLFSDDIESTLSQYLRPSTNVDDAVRDKLKAIRAKLFDARIAAHAGDRGPEAELTTQLAGCVELVEDDECARDLVHHLPGWARPIPDVDMHALVETRARTGSALFATRYFCFTNQRWFSTDVRFQLRTFTVSLEKHDTLELNDIIVIDTRTDREPTCSPGLGTAALEHLCRTADHYALNIVGKIMPGDRTEHSAERLANWYGRHGFEVHRRQPGVSLWAKIRRTPRPADK